jgi:hypothetical protein
LLGQLAQLLDRLLEVGDPVTACCSTLADQSGLPRSRLLQT